MANILPGVILPLMALLVMFAFGLYTYRNSKWVALCLAWGILAFILSFYINRLLLGLGLSKLAISAVFSPLIQQIVVALGTYYVIRKDNFDNLIDGAVYGFASGLGYSMLDSAVKAADAVSPTIVTLFVTSFASSLVYATASGIVGMAMIQFFFYHRTENRNLILLSAMGAGIGYTALYNIIIEQSFGGEYLPAGYGIGGLTLVGLYITGQLRRILIQVGVEKRRADNLLEIVIPIGVQLGTEKDFSRLLERILVEAKKFCKADAGTLYLLKDNQLEFAVVRNDTLGIAAGGTTTEKVGLPPLMLYVDGGNPNHNNIATHVAISGETANIPDAYNTTEFDFAGTRVFDKLNGYQSISFLTIPLKNAEGRVLGVLQLINALNPKHEIVAFDKNLQQLMGPFSLLATAALEGYIQEQKLRAEIQQLRIEIDAVKRSKQVDEITNTDYFRNLREKARNLRDSNPTDSKNPGDQKV